MSLTLSLRERLRGWFESPIDVGLVCEIAADYVAAVRYGDGRIQGWALRELPAGAVSPAPLADNITDATAVQEALRQAIEAVADGQRRCALLVPDLVARVALVELDQLPRRTAEADGLLRWRLKKDLPFEVSQAVLCYKDQAGRTAPHEVLAVASLRSILRQYEACVEQLGLHPGRVTLSTLAALEHLELADTTPRLLVKRDHGSLSLAIVQGEAIRLFRSLPLASRGRGQSETALFDKTYAAVVYFQDQWDQEITEVVLAGLGGVQVALRHQLERELGCVTREVDLASAHLPARSSTGALADHRLLPTVGWVRGQAE